MSAFEREHNRYLVIKDKDLTLGQRFALNYVLREQAIQTRETVVIEADWPIYEQTWDMVQRLAEGRVQELDELRANATERERLMMQLSVALNYDAPKPSMCDLVAEAQLLVKERDALAAHVERITGLFRDLDECEQDSAEMGAVWDRLEGALQEGPSTSLARRNEQVKADVIELWAACLENIINHIEARHSKDPNYPDVSAEGMREFAADMRDASARLRGQPAGGDAK